MADGGRFFDPIALVAALVVAGASFILVPGVGTAIGAALGIAVLTYIVVIGVKLTRSSGSGRVKPAVGAGSEATAAITVKRGSDADIWLGRGAKALSAMDEVVANCAQPLIRGQLENVAIESRDTGPVLNQLATEVASIQRALDEAAAATRAGQPIESASAVGASADDSVHSDLTRQQDVLRRLTASRDDVVGRMKTLVLGLERVHSEMIETAASVTTSDGVMDADNDQHLRDLSDQLAGLRAGLEETRRHTRNVLGDQ